MKGHMAPKPSGTGAYFPDISQSKGPYYLPKPRESLAGRGRPCESLAGRGRKITLDCNILSHFARIKLESDSSKLIFYGGCIINLQRPYVFFEHSLFPLVRSWGKWGRGG